METENEDRVLAQDRHSRMYERVLSAASDIAARGGGRRFTVAEVQARLPGLTDGQVRDSLKMLKQMGRVHGLGGGHYEIDAAAPPAREVAVRRSRDGWYLIEVDGRHRLTLTDEEYKVLGGFSSGYATRVYTDERVRELEAEIRALRQGLDRVSSRERVRTHREKNETLAGV